jgi:hypothetical protein
MSHKNLTSQIQTIRRAAIWHIKTSRRCPSKPEQKDAENGFGFMFSQMGSSATGLVSAPMLSISIVTLSPGFNQRGGLLAIPTP